MTKTVPELHPLLEQEVQNLLEKGEICDVPFCEDGFYICNPNKGRKHASNNRPESSKSLHRHTAFSNGEFGYSKVSSQARSLHDQDRSQGRILFGSYSPSVAKQSIPVLFSSVRSLNIAPSLFTCLMKPVAGFLRKRGVRLLLYLDDMLIIGSTLREVNDFTQMAVNLLKALGFIINLDKSVLTPTQVITFLGFAINSITMRFTLPSKKVQKLLTLCRQIRSNSTVLLRTLAQLVGLLESYRLAMWQAPLHFRYLEALLIRGLNQMNQRNLFIIAYHVPGKTNVVVDCESREFIDNSDWKIGPVVISSFLKDCSTDLFASRLTHQLARALEARPQSIPVGHLQCELDTPKGLGIPSVQPHRAGSRQGDDGQDGSCSGSTNMASATLVAPPARHAGTTTSSASVLIDSSNRPNGSPAHSPDVPSSSPGRISHLQQRYQAEGIPRNATQLSSQQLEIPHRKHTSPAGNAGAAGVIRGKLILFQHL